MKHVKQVTKAIPMKAQGNCAAKAVIAALVSGDGEGSWRIFQGVMMNKGCAPHVT